MIKDADLILTNFTKVIEEASVDGKVDLWKYQCLVANLLGLEIEELAIVAEVLKTQYGDNIAKIIGVLGYYLEAKRLSKIKV